MTVQLTISYETLLELVKQLPEDQQQDLIRHLPGHGRAEELTASDRIRLLRSVQVDRPLDEGFSLRREDWYDDEHR